MNQEEFFRMVNEAEGRQAISFPVIMRKVYTWMCLALAITGITAFGVAGSPNIMQLIFGNQLVFWGLMIGELALVWILSARIMKMSLTSATLMFIVYAVLNGITMSSIFMVYTMSSIASTFFVCSATFGAMSLYGYFTKSDLTSLGRLAIMALIGLIIASVVNIFVGSSTLGLIVSYLGVLVFVGLTAYDTQKIKMMAMQLPVADANAQKLGVLGALSLYLDFINLFLYLLRIFGGRRD